MQISDAFNSTSSSMFMNKVKISCYRDISACWIFVGFHKLESSIDLFFFFCIFTEMINTSNLLQKNKINEKYIK